MIYNGGKIGTFDNNILLIELWNHELTIFNDFKTLQIKKL